MQRVLVTNKATRRVSSFIPKSPCGTYVGRDVTCIMRMRSIPKSPHGTYTYARASSMHAKACVHVVNMLSQSAYQQSKMATIS